MFEQISYILTKISSFQLNILLLLGLALFGGVLGGRLFQKLHIPQVVGYIVIGIIIGESFLKIIGHDTVVALQPFNYFALGLIGFMIGGELKKEVFAKYGRQFFKILFFEGITAFLAVSIFIGMLGTLLFGDWKFAWALGLLLGAIASATAPATTTIVLREYKTRGPLTRTILGIVALDDALALLLFAVASSIASSLTGRLQQGILKAFVTPIYEIGMAICIGLVAGIVLNKIFKKYSEKERLLAFSVGAVLFVTGLALLIHVDMLLAAMTLGVVVANFAPRKSQDAFKLVEGFTPPIHVIFFVLVGAKFNIHHMTLPIILLATVYLIARSAGKAIGASLGARISGAAKSVQKYLPLCLFSQAGVAIGLSILASHYFPGRIGNIIVIIVTATALILEIIGPALVKIAVTKAGEVGLNITEEDLIDSTKATDLMDKKPPLISKNMSLSEILDIFSKSPNLYYPVVDADKKLLGVITVDSIKNIFMETGLSSLLLAIDVMEEPVASVNPESSLSSVKELLDKYNLEYLPVVTNDNVMKGFIERRILAKLISTKILELQRQADSLEGVS